MNSVISVKEFMDDGYWDGKSRFYIYDPSGKRVATRNTRRKAEQLAIKLSKGLWMTANSYYYLEEGQTI